MSTVDQAKEQARAIYMRCASSKFGDPRYSCHVNSAELRSLLETVLSWAPVVEAAQEWRTCGCGPFGDCSEDHGDDCSVNRVSYALAAAIDAITGKDAGK